MAWSSVVWVGRSTSIVRAATAGTIPLLFAFPAGAYYELPSKHIATSPASTGRPPGHAVAVNVDTPMSSTTSVERCGRLGRYGSAREADIASMGVEIAASVRLACRPQTGCGRGLGQLPPRVGDGSAAVGHSRHHDQGKQSEPVKGRKHTLRSEMTSKGPSSCLSVRMLAR
jgi:hypothetical protein